MARSRRRGGRWAPVAPVRLRPERGGRRASGWVPGRSASHSAASSTPVTGSSNIRTAPRVGPTRRYPATRPAVGSAALKTPATMMRSQSVRTRRAARRGDRLPDQVDQREQQQEIGDEREPAQQGRSLERRNRGEAPRSREGVAGLTGCRHEGEDDCQGRLRPRQRHPRVHHHQHHSRPRRAGWPPADAGPGAQP